jgi:hypothetical protein
MKPTEDIMNTHLLVLLALGAGVAMHAALAGEPSVAAEHATVAQAMPPALVAETAPVPQRAANAPIGAATDAAASAPPAATDWSYTPRRSFQARHR